MTPTPEAVNVPEAIVAKTPTPEAKNTPDASVTPTPDAVYNPEATITPEATATISPEVAARLVVATARVIFNHQLRLGGITL